MLISDCKVLLHVNRRKSVRVYRPVISSSSLSSHTNANASCLLTTMLPTLASLRSKIINNTAVQYYHSYDFITVCPYLYSFHLGVVRDPLRCAFCQPFYFYSTAFQSTSQVSTLLFLLVGEIAFTSHINNYKHTNK